MRALKDVTVIQDTGGVRCPCSSSLQPTSIQKSRQGARVQKLSCHACRHIMLHRQCKSNEVVRFTSLSNCGDGMRLRIGVLGGIEVVITAIRSSPRPSSHVQDSGRTRLKPTNGWTLTVCVIPRDGGNMVPPCDSNPQRRLALLARAIGKEAGGENT